MRRSFKLCFLVSPLAIALAMFPPALHAQEPAASSSKSAAAKKTPDTKTASSSTASPPTATAPAASPTIARPTGNTASAGAASTNSTGPVRADNYRSKTGGRSAGTGPVNNSASHNQPDEAVSRRYRTRRDSPERKGAKQEKPTP